MEFRENLYRLRREQSLNQEQLAEKIGVSRQAVSKWETGEASPDLPNLLALADALGVSLDTLCGRADRSAPSPPPVAEVPVSETPAVKNRYRWSRILIAAILIAAPIPVLFIFANYVWPEAAETTAEATEAPYIALDTQNYLRLVEALSRAEFALSDGGLLTCRVFCGAENADTFHYGFQFLDPENNVYSIAAGYRDGVIIGETYLSLRDWTYASIACLRVWDDERDESSFILIPLASNVELDHSANSVTWNPLD